MSAGVEVAARSAAAAWAGAGRPVFPAGHNKKPLTPHGLLDASTAPDVIRAWWERWPRANIGVRMGQPSGLVVLDVDGQDGADALHEFERQHGELPVTASVVTPRRGQHFYFVWPGFTVKTTAGALATGIDVRGDGGYVLVPPSSTVAGAYEWDETAPPAPMPAWLIDLTRGDRSAGEAQVQARELWVGMLRDGILEGGRNGSLTRLTGYLLRRYVAVDLAGALVHMVNGTCCRPPLAPAEVDRIIESVARMELTRRERKAAR